MWLMVVVVMLSNEARSAEPRGKMLSLSQIMKAMQASKTSYVIRTLEGLDVARGTFAATLWPQAIAPANIPKVVRKNGQVTVTEWPQSAELGAALRRADEAYNQKNYAEAEKRFRAAVALAPGDPIAHAFLGDALLFSGKATEAKAEYDRAIAINPDDYRLYFFRSNAWRHLEDPAKARDDLRTSLTLKPRNPTLLNSVEHGGIGVHVEPDILVPQSFARREGEAIIVYADPKQMGWFAWANCKGFWLGEPEHRKALTGSSTSAWTSQEEVECLAALLTGYELQLKTDPTPDPRLEQLKAIVDDGLATGLVLYELGSRIDPQIMLRIDPEARALVRKYVEKYVLTDAPEAPKPPADAGE
jgi:tetratricopeptide (TPR) repeat protein